MKHDELQESLACHLRGNTDRMVWTNTQLGPSGSPRPDVFTVDKSYARFRTDCYECKVSVSDLRHDVTSGKWQSYRKFGHAVWFAFPRGMAPLDLVPKECGVILLGESWRAARKPVAQVLETLPRDAWLKLLMTPHEEGREPHPRYSGGPWFAMELARRKQGDELAELMSKRANARANFERATRRIETAAADANRKADELLHEARRRAEGQEYALSAAQRNLGEALGMDDGDITPDALADRIRLLTRSLRLHDLKGAIEAMQRLQTLLQRAEATA